MYVVDRRRNSRGREEEEEEEDGESEMTEEESTTSSFTERWSERDREEESDFSVRVGAGRRGSDASCPPHAVSLDDWKTEDAGSGSGSEVAAPKWASEAMSSIVLNQQVCRVLLQECERSLETAERNTPDHTHSLTHSLTLSQSYDEVDGVGGAGVLSGAVGPPSCYSPQVKGSGWDQMGALGGALWLGEFPSGSEASLSMCTATADLTHTQAGESESRSFSRTANHRRSSTTLSADSEEECPLVASASASTPRPRWTSDVVDLVSRMTCGRLGLCVAPPISSESEECEEGSVRGHTHFPPQAPPIRTPQHDLKLEKIFKSFAGGASESEDDAEFHTINRTISLSPDVLDGADPNISSRNRAEQNHHSMHRTHDAEQNHSMHRTHDAEQNHSMHRTHDAEQNHSMHRTHNAEQNHSMHRTHDTEQNHHSIHRTHEAEQNHHSMHRTHNAEQNHSIHRTHDTEKNHSVHRTHNAQWSHHSREEEDLTAECTLTENDSDSDGTYSLVEGSSMYHTPGPGTENPTSEEEDLDVTVEVCRPLSVFIDTQTGERPAAVCRPEGREQFIADQELPDIRCVSCNKQIDDPSLLSRLPDLAADFAEISSITCSPLQQEKIPLSRRPCYSTPCTPQKTPHLPQRMLGAHSHPLPSLQSLLDHSEHTHSSQRESSASSIVPHSPDRESSVEEADSPRASQSGFSMATSHMHRGRDMSHAMEEESDEEEEEQRGEGSVGDGRDSEHTHSFSSSPSEGQPSRTESLAAFEEEEERMLEEVVDREWGEEEEEPSEEEEEPSEELQSEGRLSDEDFVSVDDSPERGLALGTEALACGIEKNQPTEGMEETERASSTLDDILQGMMADRAANQRARSPGPLFLSRAVMNMEGEVDEEDVYGRGGDTAEHYLEPQVGDPSDGSAKPEDRMEEAAAFHGIWSHLHRVIVLEHTPGKEPFRKTREPPT
ncbi:uncharacterized protein LOC125291228 isoform X2 [Alosa alosa]|uniref:uncharacterized protein LOC125291228 isoform X2 n=1 Tax=Alosa alosa TaxID=278164 RepID=UPI00201504E4|nr:uncharacterized protein LOC125291228 isoform X2 [Alosa alosa]